MTARVERIFTITCDWCPTEHHKSSTTSAMEARIAAGIDGWAFRQGRGNSKDPAARRDTDACPEHAHHITQENQA